MAATYVISDTHFGHGSMLTFLTAEGHRLRPFTSVEEMDEHIIERWNSVVRPHDHVYHLGDVAMKKTGLAQVQRLHGHKRLVPGNHDIFEAKDYLAAGFEKVYGMRVLDGWLFTHLPVHPSQLGERFKGNVHGHLHEKEPPEGPYLNVSVEAVNYRPVPLEALDGLLAVQVAFRQVRAVAAVSNRIRGVLL
jgi:calcineurin-like phosphoesterase family protein